MIQKAEEPGVPTCNSGDLLRVAREGLWEHQAFYSRYDFELYSNFTFFLNDSIQGDQIRQKEVRDILGYQGTYKRSHSTHTYTLKHNIGWGIRHDIVKDNELSRSQNRTTTLEQLSLGNVYETNAWAFLSENWSYKRWQLDLSARLDLFRFAYADRLLPNSSSDPVWKAIISPKLNLQFQASPKMVLFAKTGLGFHSNDSRVVVARSGEQVLPPAYGLDVGAQFKLFPRLLINTALWGLWMEQEFVYVGDEGVVEPSGRTRRMGWEFSARWQIGRQWFADLDLNLTQPRSLEAEEGEHYIPLAPTFTSIGGLTWKSDKGSQASLRYRYIHDRPANEDNSLQAEGYTVVDATVQHRFQSWSIGVTIENLLNTEWREAQFETESQLRGEAMSVSEIHFTPGVPFFVKGQVAVFF